MGSILFGKSSSIIYENYWRHLCSSGERLCIRKCSKVFWHLWIWTKKGYHPAHRIFGVDETGITTVQHRHSKVVSMRGKKEVASLTLAERGSLNHFCHPYECYWNIHSTINHVPEKKYGGGAYGWRTSGLNFGLPSELLDSDGYIY